MLSMTCGRRMCRRFLGTLQVRPCKLYDDIHVIKGLSRIYTKLEKHKLLACVLTIEKERAIST